MGIFALITIITFFLIGSISMIFSLIGEKEPTKYEYRNSPAKTNPKNNDKLEPLLENDFLIFDDDLELE